MKPYVIRFAAAFFVLSFLMSSPLLAGDAVIEEGKTVKMHYLMKVGEDIVEDTRGMGPFEFVYGSQAILPSVEEQIKGMKAGDNKEMSLTADQAFGPVNPQAIMEMPRDKFPPDHQIEVGQVFTSDGPGGTPIRGIVLEVNDERVLMDFNHPLAGKDLTFSVEILEVS